MTKDEILKKLAAGELEVDVASKMLAELEQPKRGFALLQGQRKGCRQRLWPATDAGHALRRAVGAAAGFCGRDQAVPQGPR